MDMTKNSFLRSKKVIMLIIGFLISLVFGLAIEAKGEISEQEVLQAFEIFPHQRIDGVKFEQSSEGIYEMASKDMFFSGYRASFSKEGTAFKGEDILLAVNLDFLSSLTPQKIEERQGRIIYYFSDFLIIYTPINNGLKSDIVFFEPLEDNFSFSWKIDLKDGIMEARIEEDGSVGIYGPGKLLSGAQTSDNFSQEVLEEMQKKSAKTQLLYAIPAPVIIEANGNLHENLAYYKIENDVLELKAKNDLSGLTYPISIDPSISLGSESVFRPEPLSLNITAAALDSTHALIAFGTGGSNTRRAVIATISGTNVSYGPKYSFDTTASQELCSAALDSTHVLIAYHDPLGAYGTAIVATINLATSAISFGSEYRFNSLQNSEVSATALDSTHALIAVSRNNQGAAVVATIDLATSAISFGSEYVFNSGNVSYPRAVALDSETALIVYQDNGNTNDGTAIVATIDLATSAISYGSEYVFNSGSAFYIAATALDPACVFIAYNVGGRGKAIIAHISESVVSYGPEYTSSPCPTAISATTLDPENALVSFIDFNNNDYGIALLATVDPFDSSISFGSEHIFNPGDTVWATHAVTLDYYDVLIAYEDEENSGYGTVSIAGISGLWPLPTVATKAATNVNFNSAQLNGDLVDLGDTASANIYFQWGLTDNYGNNTGSTNKSSLGVFSESINGLSSGDTYHFRAVASSINGTSYGGDRTFTTLSVPNSIPNASSVTDSPDTVDIGSNVTFNGDWSEPDAGDNVKMYICKDSTCSNCNNASQTNCWIYSTVWNTEPDTTDTCAYTAQLGDVGSNNYWLGVCDDDNACDPVPLFGGAFTINPIVTDPTVLTTSEQSTTSDSAQLNGWLTDLGGAASVNVWFEWEETAVEPAGSYANTLSSPGSPKGGIDTFFATLSGLDPGTDYYFRAAAQNTAGTSYGAGEHFVTAIIPPPAATGLSCTGDSKEMYCLDYATTTGDVVSGRGGAVDFSWTYNHPSGTDMKNFLFQAAASPFPTANLVVNVDISSSAIDGAAVTYPVNVCSEADCGTLGSNKLAYDTNYYWQVKVCDVNNVCSDWTGALMQAQIPNHRAPEPNFSWTVLQPAADKIAQFCSVKEGDCSAMLDIDKSVCYNTSDQPISCTAATIKWTIPATAQFATSSAATDANPKIKFTELGTNEITLEITGSGPCAKCKSMEVSSLPTWIEDDPFK